MRFQKVLNLLFDGNLNGYLDAMETRLKNERRSYFLIHIPKTAGSSFREEIADVRQPDFNVEVDYNLLSRSGDGLSYELLIQQSLENLKAFKQKAYIPFVSGHVLYSRATEAVGIDEFDYIAVLRNPIDRLLSDYAYRTSDQHPLYLSEQKRYPTFGVFVADVANQNVMKTYLASRDASEDMTELAESISNQFSMIGVTEFYGLALKTIMATLGCRAKASHSLRRSGVSIEERTKQVNSSDISLAVKLNADDMYLYRYFLNKWKSISSSLHYNYDYDRIFRMRAGLPFRA